MMCSQRWETSPPPWPFARTTVKFQKLWKKHLLLFRQEVVLARGGGGYNTTFGAPMGSSRLKWCRNSVTACQRCPQALKTGHFGTDIGSEMDQEHAFPKMIGEHLGCSRKRIEGILSPSRPILVR